MIKGVLWIGCLCLTLSSCVVGPDFVPPCVDTPEKFRFQIEKTEDTINTPWWEQFEDQVLISLIDEALANNYDIKVASAHVEEALGILIQVKSQFFPQIGYSASAMKMKQSTKMGTPLSSMNQNIPTPMMSSSSSLMNDPLSAMTPSFPNPTTAFLLAVNGTWELDLFGRITRLVESAKASLFAAEEAHRGVIESVVALTANTYLQLLGLDAQLAISKETLNSYGEMVTYFKKQFFYGQVSKINVAQALTQYEQAAAAIPQLEIRIAETENALSVLLGRSPGPIPRDKTIYTIKLPSVPEGVPSELLMRRPDIRQSELELIAENAQIGAAIALYFPSISLTGSLGRASKDLEDLFSKGSTIWNFGANISGPLLTFGAISGQVKQAESATARAFYTYENVVLRAFKEVDDALINHTLLNVRLKAQQRLVKAAAEYQYLAMLQYKEGYSPYFVVLQAQQQLFPAELSWVETQVALFTSLINIYQAMGGGWIILAEYKTYSCP